MRILCCSKAKESGLGYEEKEVANIERRASSISSGKYFIFAF